MNPQPTHRGEERRRSDGAKPIDCLHAMAKNGKKGNERKTPTRLEAEEEEERKMTSVFYRFQPAKIILLCDRSMQQPRGLSS